MPKRFILPLLLILVAFLAAHFSIVGVNGPSLALAHDDNGGGVVDKTQSEAFTVKIEFENTGTTRGSWIVNTAFEGESWSWSGTPQALTLEPSKDKTLTWHGNVPENAPVDSVARLIVYYNDSVAPLDWWIHIVSGAELTITSSTVE